MPAKKPEQVSFLDLMGGAINELDRSIHQPNILSYKPYPEQERFLSYPEKFRYISGGNRGGKTDTMVVDAIMHATNTHKWKPRPEDWGRGAIQLRFVVVDIVQGVEKIILPKLKRWCKKSMLVDGTWDKSWDKQSLTFTFSNGSTIDFLTYNMDMEKQGGVPRHIVYFDEIPPQNIFIENQMRLLDYSGWWVIGATSTNGMGWTYDEIVEPVEAGERTDCGVFYLSAEQNPYLDTEDIGEYTWGMNDEEQAIRFEGKFVAKNGLVFPQFSKKTHVMAYHELPWDEIKSQWKWYSSVDHGWNNFTAWLWHAVAPDGRIVTFSELYDHKKIIQHYASIIQERETAWGRIPDITVGDPAMGQHQAVTGTSILQEYAMRGIHISTEGIPHDVSIGIEKMQAYFNIYENGSPWGPDRPFWVIADSCTNFIRELGKLQWKAYESTKMAYERNKQEEVRKKDDHAFDSARYFSTLMPDPRPLTEQPDPTTLPKTVSYTELMARMHEDASIEFTEEESIQETPWSISDLYGFNNGI